MSGYGLGKSREEDNLQVLKDNIVAVFDRASLTYEKIGPKFIEPFNHHLVNNLPLTGDEEILDLACGRGAILFELMNKINAKGNLIGVDLSEGMVKEAKTQLEQLNVNHAEIYRMDAEQLDIPEYTFDVVTCGFSMDVFTKRYKVLKEIHRVLKRSGVFAFNIFSEDNSYIQWLFELMGKFCPYADKYYKKHWHSQCSIGCITREIVEENFDIIDFRHDKHVFEFTRKEEWWAALWSCGLRGFLEVMNEERLAAFQKMAYQEIEQFKTSNTYQIELSAWACQASKLEIY